ncbi:hypothetical protein BC937DRAFT_93472 [Endogone sp. FLAS-F59071]|nr:hypothetical protein BC937DRAFT_93472 [Endogone sp. FLAS-F59071]|eukprot:RUS21151.1 hypothetical protein BC937DRAFT_93472 [Endogone sp. FLAS-F59071]
MSRYLPLHYRSSSTRKFLIILVLLGLVLLTYTNINLNLIVQPRVVPPLSSPLPPPHVLRKLYSDQELMDNFVPERCPTPPWIRNLTAQPVRIWRVDDQSKPGAHPVKGCSTPCVLISAKQKEVATVAASADAHLYNHYYSNFRSYRFANGTELHFLNQSAPYCPLRRLVFASMESASYYPMVNEALDNGFNLLMEYRLSSDVPIPYLNDQEYDYYAEYLPYEKKRKDVIAVAFISNCAPKNDRDVWLKALMKLMPELVENGKPRHIRKLETLKEYLFTFAFENSNDEDYVTEKILHAFVSGSVPVYIGTDTIDKFVPSEHSVIKVSDFKNPEELADYLIHLSQNKQEYEAYLKWKSEPMSKQMKQIIDNNIDNWCRLCGVVAGHDVGWGGAKTW